VYRRLVLLLLLAAAGCAQPRSARCKEICAREAECQQATEDETPDEQSAFDEGDCVAACAALERDDKMAPSVEAHWVCIKQAGGDCGKLASCR
jgi:Cys-rich protein (TIGR04453 family)